MINAQDGDRLIFDFINYDVRHACDNELARAFHITDAAIGWKLEQPVNACTDCTAELLCGRGVVFRDKLEQGNKVVGRRGRDVYSGASCPMLGVNRVDFLF